MPSPKPGPTKPGPTKPSSTKPSSTKPSSTKPSSVKSAPLVTDQLGVNMVVLCGHLSSPPQRRTLASGSELWSFEVTTPVDDGSWSVPVAWFDPPVEPTLAAGDAVVVCGAVKRRFFRGAGGTQSRTEVVATEVVPMSARQRVRRLLARHADHLGARAGGALRSSA